MKRGSYFAIAIGFAINLPLSAQTAATEVWSLREELRIGAIDGPQALSQIGTIVLSESGRYLYVSQPQERSIKIFDSASGAFLRAVGRSGSGPGEFSLVSTIGTKQDTLFAIDSHQQHLVLFSGTGEHIRTENLAPMMSSAVEGMPLEPIGLARNGMFFAQRPASLAQIAYGAVESTPVVQLTREGRLLRTLIQHRPVPRVETFSIGNRIGIALIPFSRNSLVSIASDGSSLLHLDMPVPAAETGRFWLTRMGLSGDTLYRRSYNYSPQPISTAVLDSIHGALTIVAEAITLPRLMPPITDIHLNPDGSVWMKRGPRRIDLDDWLVLDSVGSIRASLQIPSNIRIVLADETRAWGAVTSELGVPYVVRYQIRK